MVRDPGRKRFGNLPYSLLASAGLVYGICMAPGCAIAQHSATVKEAPISKEYKLDKKLCGKVCVLLAEARTGEEKDRNAVSDALARVLQNYNKDDLEVVSYTDFSNMLIVKKREDRYSEMMGRHTQSALFSRSDLEFVREITGADYIFQPALLEFSQRDRKRFDLPLVGITFLGTRSSNTKVLFEVWDTRTGEKRFGVSSESNIGVESIKEKPVSLEYSLEEAFTEAVKKLPQK